MSAALVAVPVGSDAEPSFNAAQTVALTGITYRMLDYWCRTGYLRRDMPGSGNYRRFTERDIRVLKLAPRLIAAGFTTPRACAIAAELIDNGHYSAGFADKYDLIILRRPAPEGTIP